MPRRRQQTLRRPIIDPSTLPPDLVAPSPPDLKLQVRGNQKSGYRVCTYLSSWRPVVKGDATTPRKEGTCVASHVKTVGYIENYQRSGRIIFVPDFYLEVPNLRYYEVYRDFDHCVYQLRAEWREIWLLTKHAAYQPPEESLNLKAELSKQRRLAAAQKKAAQAQG